MKKLLSTFIACLFFSAFIAQPTVPQVQKSLYGIVEATWCGNCGQYGIPTTNQVISQTSNKAVFFSMHANSSSALHSTTAQNLAAAIGTSGQPYWTLNGNAIGGYSASIENNMINSINTNYSATTTDVNAGFEWNIVNDTIYIETLTEFFNAANGEYYVAVYLSEDDIYAYQSNYDPNIPNGNIYHDHILRTSFTASVFGNQIVNGTIAAGSTYTNFQKIKVDPSWNLNKIHISVAVWEKNGNSYTFKNINDQGSNLTSIDLTENKIDYNVYPNPSLGIFNLQLNGEPKDYSISLYNLLGKNVYTEDFGNETSVKTLDFSNLEKGIYILNVNNGETNSSEKLIIN